MTLDEDVVERLKQESRKRGLSFKQTINEVIRTGLASSKGDPTQKAFRVEAKRMGTMPGVNYDSVSGLLDLLDGEGRR